MTDQSNNNGGNNINISGTNINIDGGISQQQNNQFDDFGRLQINAYRSRITPLKVSSGQLLSVGVVTFALAMLDTFGSLASLLSLSQGQTTPYLDRIFGNASLFIIMLSGLCLIFGIWLHFRSGSMGLPYFLGNLERAKSRKLFLTDVKAKCPMCPTGIMSMYPASKRNQDHTLVCNNSPDHRLVFDMTTLPDVEEEYNVRKA